MFNSEKQLGTPPSAMDDMPDKVEPQEPWPDDANPTEKPEDAKPSGMAEAVAEEEKKGSMRDYFVSAGRDQAYPIGLIPSSLPANIPICRPTGLCVVRRGTDRRDCSRRRSTFDDVGIRLINSYL